MTTSPNDPRRLTSIRRGMARYKSLHQQRVEAFMNGIGTESQAIPELPTIPSQFIRKLRAKLIFEESMETICALGVKVFCTVEHGGEKITLSLNEVGDNVPEPEEDPFSFEATDYCNLEGVVDGVCDIKVVATGTLSSFGVADEEPQVLVDNANLAKLGPGHRIRDDGKLIKPTDWKAPELLANLYDQGAAESLIVSNQHA